MLVELMVENYAVIERLRVRFHPGFNVLSGETGSGKSIVVGALGLLFGGRASAELIRTGCERARVAGIFDFGAAASVRQTLEALGIALEDGELLLEREILANGKSRAFASSRPITASALRSLAPLLGDIHGQHEQQRLFEKAEQLAILDAFAGLEETLAKVHDLYECWRAAAVELEALDRGEQERLRLTDLWAYQAREIEAAAPKPGEDEALEQERRLLQNATRLQENAGVAFEALYEAPGSALAMLRQARKRVEELARIDPAMVRLVESLDSAETVLDDVSLALRDYLARLESDPARLDFVESRLASLERLKRKYGPTLADVMAFHENLRRQLESSENAEARRAALGKKLDEAAAAYLEAAQRLSELRREAARRLEKNVEQELACLAMERSRFRVAFASRPWSREGVDDVEFLISPNPGEQLRPLDKIASGGELSRVALALKTCAVKAGTRETAAQRTLVFDEVDAGIGGRAAEDVGRRLKQIAAANQVLCVTHLAQIAGFADHHYAVEKRQLKGRTTAVIRELDQEERTREIGRMLSGAQVTPEALKHAAQLLKLGACGGG